MRATILALLFCCSLSYAILPLPYPSELSLDDEEETSELVGDPKDVLVYNELFHHSKQRELELPSFGSQKSALGYVPNETFTVPEELKTRVEFWKKIYSHYTSSQAVLHDAEFPEIVYGVIDVSRIIKDESKSYRAQMRALNKFLKQEKEKVVVQLKRLHSFQRDIAEIPVELQTIVRKFDSIKEEDKFLEASKRIRAQRGLRDQVVQGFLFGGRYFKHLMKIFEERGIPQELTRLPLVESMFNLNARSKVGASGIWQFMKSTGKHYVRIDKFIDERNDPIAATYGAAELLRQNYETLGSWPLAVTAWNHGREGMARASRLLATTDLFQIIKFYKARSFGFASSNFYCEFLAMLEVEREYRKHFGRLMVDDPLDFQEVTVAEEVPFAQIAKGCGMDPRELRVYNPGLTDRAVQDKVMLPKGIRLRIPPEKSSECLASRKLLS